MAALELGGRRFGPDNYVVMGIVNTTPDSFYDHGATFDPEAALDRVARIVAEGAAIVDVGGVKAGVGPEVDVTEEIRRTAGLVESIREHFPDVVISVDTWRSPVADVLCRAGADLINDSWSGYDPGIVDVAARYDVGLVCTHTGGMTPRTNPHRPAYADPMADVIGTVTALADRAVRAGVRRERILVDPTHDFGKNTWHSLALTRRLDELVDTGWPVLVALSRKDFVGETLDLPPGDRLTGTLAATSISAWLGARVFRAHDVAQTRQTLDMVASIRGTRPPARPRRGLA